MPQRVAERQRIAVGHALVLIQDIDVRQRLPTRPRSARPHQQAQYNTRAYLQILDALRRRVPERLELVDALERAGVASLPLPLRRTNNRQSGSSHGCQHHTEPHRAEEDDAEQ